MRDHGAVPLEHDVDLVRDRELARNLDAVGLHLFDRAAEQPRHLARVRRDHDVPLVAADEPPGIVGKRQHGVGVEHERHRRPIDQRAHERRADSPRPSPGPQAITSCRSASTASAAASATCPSASSASGSVMYSAASDATIG